MIFKKCYDWFMARWSYNPFEDALQAQDATCALERRIRAEPDIAQDIAQVRQGKRLIELHPEMSMEQLSLTIHAHLDAKEKEGENQ